MTMICIGNKCSVEVHEITMVMAISEILEQTVISAAKHDGKLITLRGAASVRTAVFLRNGRVILTPLSETKIRERIHAATAI